MYSVDRNRAGKGNRMFPETAVGGVRAGINYAAANNQKYQYNSSSIPYLNKNTGGAGAQASSLNNAAGIKHWNKAVM